MMQILTTLTSLILMTTALPLEHDFLGLSQVDMGQLATILLTPHIETSDHLSDTIHHIIETSGGVVSKVKSGAVHTSHLIESQKDAAIGAALIPIEVAAKSAAVGAAVPALAAMKGSLVGTAIATPIIIKAVAFPGVAAGKTAAVLAAPALLTHNLHAKVIKTTHRLKNALKKGAVVAGKLALKPIALIAGTQLKLIGSGLEIGGKVVGATGAGIKKAGTVVKHAGLGSIGLGASAIGWGLDKTTIDKHFEETHKFAHHNSS